MKHFCTGIFCFLVTYILTTQVEHAHASMIDSFVARVKIVFLKNGETEDVSREESQKLSLLAPHIENATSSEGDETNDDVLEVKSGPLRLSTEEVDYPTEDTITLYEVKKGDTVASVAKLFGVTTNTILWANTIESPGPKEGDVLVILPITGIKYTTKQGDTLASIAKRYKGDISEIAKYNGLSEEATFAVGTSIIIPDGEVDVPKPKTDSKLAVKKTVKKLATTPLGFFVKPLTWFIKTQGIHGKNAVDLAGKLGSPIVATASGRVIVAKMGGYNGGYGNMIVIAHKNNIQTLYAHLQNINVNSGQTVEQGQVIGALGSTGRSTGPHLHIEVRGASNPF